MVKIIDKRRMYRKTSEALVALFLIGWLVLYFEIATTSVTYEAKKVGIVLESSCTTKTVRHIKWPDTHTEQCRMLVKWPDKIEKLNFNKPALVGDKICLYIKRTSVTYKSFLTEPRRGIDRIESGLLPCYLIPELKDI